MEFTIKKYLKNGRFYVKPILKKLDATDEEKITKFGEPKIKVKCEDGNEIDYPISVLSRISEYGFYLQDDAEKYLIDLKNQINEIKSKLEKMTDNWTSEEVL